MALRTARFWPDGRPDRPRVRQTGAVAGLLLLSTLGGCSGPVETYRSLAGISQNDPDPQTAPFTHNLAEGEAEPYPNLGSFPPLPTPTTNAADRQKLTQSLIADRRATASQAGAPAPRPAAEATAAPGSPGGNFAPAPAARAEPATEQPSNPSPAASAPSHTALNSDQSGRRPAGEPPAPGPLESTLQTPQIPSLPEPETAQPPPPPPVMPAVPRAVAVAEPPPAALADVAPQPAPPVPDMTPPPAPVKVAPPPAPAPTPTVVATLELPGNAVEPAAPDQVQIARVAALYKKAGGSVRVLAYAAAPAGGGDPLDAYHAALDRAQAVAKALIGSGVPADKIQTEAAPAARAREAGRVEIQFTP
ncbi:MAG: hypothetical protein ACHQC9_05980 [Alphaproteobacteria bacterium]